MPSSEYLAIGSVITAIITILTAYNLVSKFKKEIREEIERDVKGQIKALQDKIKANKEASDKDIENIKNVFNNEIRHLAEKIDTLRDENRQQHRQSMEQQSQLIDFIKQTIRD